MSVPTVSKFFDIRYRMLKTTAVSVSLVMAASSVCMCPNSEAKKGARRAAPAAGGGGGGGQIMLSTPNPRTPLEWNNRAVELGSKGLWADAIRHHEEAVSLMDPNTVEYDDFERNLSGACLRYGDKLASQKKWYEASVQYRKALYADPNNEMADNQLSMALKAMGKNPDDPSVRHQIAEAAETDGRYRTAIVEYRKVARMRDDGISHYNLARAYHKDGGFKDRDALQELKIAVNKPWSDKIELAKCHSMMGDMLWQYAIIARDNGKRDVALKRMNNAAICYRRAVTLNPSYSDAINGLKEVARESVSIAPTFDNFLMLAGAYQLAGDAAHARMAFEECWKRNPNSPILEKARRSFIRFVVCSPLSAPDEVEKGLERIKQNLTKNNKDAEMLYLFGRAMERKGDTTTALRAYQAASSINAYADPDLPQRISVLTGGAPPAASTASAGSLPGASASGGKPAAAAAGAPAAAAPVPQQPQKDPQRFAAIESKVRSGDTDGAIKELQALTEKDPGDGQAWYRLGAAYEKKGDLDQASVSYRQAYLLSVAEAKDALRQVDTSRIQQIKQEAEKQEAAGNWVGAAASWKEAVTIASLLPLAHRKLSIALKNLGDEKGAEKEMKKAEELEKDDKK